MELQTARFRNRQYKDELRETFNYLHGTDYKSITPIRHYLESMYEMDFDDINVETAYEYLEHYLITEQDKLNEDVDIRIQNIRDKIKKQKDIIIPVKVAKKHFEKLKVMLLTLDIEETNFTRDTLNEIFDYIKLVNDEIPNGFIRGLFLIGKSYKKDELETENKTIYKSFLTDDIQDIINEIDEREDLLNPPSDILNTITSINMFYEEGQGGAFKKISYDDLKNYNIYSSNSKNSCGKDILKFYGIDGKKGFIPITEMRALLSEKNIKVVENPIEELEFVLLRDNHYVRCIHQDKFKELSKIKRKENEKENNDKKIEKIKNKNISVFDCESFGRTQSVVLIGTFNGENYKSYYGINCIELFVKNLECEYLIGYNCNKYDYILVKNEFIKQGYSIEEFRRSANSLLRATFTKDNKQICLVDLLNFTQGTLKKNLESYECSTAKGEFDYDKINFNMEEKDVELLEEYCKKDVIGTYELYEKLDKPFNDYGLTLLDLFTTSQGAYKILKKKWKDKGILQERIPRKIDKFFRKSIYGGRCEVFKREYKSSHYEDIKKGKMKYEDIKDFMRAFDVNSLYPYVMKKYEYPIGNAIFTTKFKVDKMGIYECKVKKPKNLKFPVLCNNGKYDLDDNNGTYTSVDIKMGIDYGYEFQIKCGYYWEESSSVFVDYVDEFYGIKKNSVSGSPIYKNAKLMLNSPYGKCLQNDKKEKHFVIQTQEELTELKKKYKNGRFRCEMKNECLYIDYEEELEEFTNKKSWIGAFILSYSKIIISNLLQKVDAYYTDTDSIYTHNNDSKYFDIGNELGQFSDDIEGKIIYACFVAKKLKYIEYITKDGKIKTEITGKGCYLKGLRKIDFKKMLLGYKIENSNPFKLKRDLKNGTMKKVKDLKEISMNNGNRIFTKNESLPIGYIS